MKHKLLELDPQLTPFEKDLDLRMQRYKATKKALLAPGQTLSDFANGYLFFGFHQVSGGWYYREWAPGAEAMFLTGDFNGWDKTACPLNHTENLVKSKIL